MRSSCPTDINNSVHQPVIDTHRSALSHYNKSTSEGFVSFDNDGTSGLAHELNFYRWMKRWLLVAKLS